MIYPLKKDNKPEPRPGIKSCLKEKSTTGKESSSRDKLSAKISTNKDKPLSLSAKSAGRPVLTNQPTATVAKTTFASTLKKELMIFLILLLKPFLECLSRASLIAQPLSEYITYLRSLPVK